MILEGGISKNYTQNWDKNGNIYYTDENGQVVDFKVNPFVKLANKVKATATNIGNWLNETDPNSEAYKQKVGTVLGLVTAPLGLGATLTGGIAKGLTPYVGRKIAQNMAQGIGSGVAGGGVAGGLEAGLNDRNIAIGGLQGATVGGLLGGLGGYGLGKVAQKLNTQTAWHGSPYKFDKFSNDAIGTGEGAQAHGYGHYAAKNKDVADERYRKGLLGQKQNRYTVDGVILDGDYPLVNNNFNPQSVVGDIEYYGGVDNLLDKYKKDLAEAAEEKLRLKAKYPENADPYFDYDFNDEMLYSNADILEKNLSNKLPFLESLKGKTIQENQGNLYKLSIPKDDVMLREDLLLSQQPKFVQQAFKDEIASFKKGLKEELQSNIDAKNILLKSLQDAKAKGSDRLIYTIEKDIERNLPVYDTKIWQLQDQLNQNIPAAMNKTGKAIYNELGENASNILGNKGIKGISYNGGIDGEANVIFNPDDIDIIPYYDNPTSLKEKFINLLNR